MNVLPNYKWKVSQEKINKDIFPVYSFDEEIQNVFSISGQVEIWAWAY